MTEVSGGKSSVLRILSLSLVNPWEMGIRSLGIRCWMLILEGRGKRDRVRGLRGVCWVGRRYDSYRVEEGEGVLKREKKLKNKFQKK